MTATDRPSALVTDLYELNMAASYLRRGIREPATFSLFIRGLPPGRGFLVASGIEAGLDFLEGFRLSGEDLAYLAGPLGFRSDDVERLAGLRFTGDVWAVPEGRVVVAGEPVLEVTAPIAEAQVVETYLLNQITLHMVVASKAARCAIAGAGVQLVDFSLRRTHGTEAGLAVARGCAIAGFAATSNVYAARRLGWTATGTMAHSYIEAFPTEEAAFRAFATDFPDRVTFLVDTYDTVRGVATAIRVIRDLGLTGNLAVRLDSGDLAALSRATRALLDEAGLHTVRIFVSGGLDEHDIERFRAGGAPIDGFGVGTRLGVSADAPSIDSVYKLVEVGGRAVLKLSSAKETLPGAKQVWRGPAGDVLGLRREPPPAGGEPLLAPVMEGGRRTGPPGRWEDARERLAADLSHLPPAALSLADPVPPVAVVTPALRDLARVTRQRLSGVAGAGPPGPP